MYSQWMPQNLQKRLLLYILQQLSLFSEIDLPNLEEVSLNNIHLKDVLIDPEKVGKLRGCTIRYGKLRNVELSGGVVGGVNFDIDGVEIVAALNVDNLQSQENNVLLLLAQSTADLASTILFEDKGPLVENVADIPDAGADPNSSAKSQKKSALGGVMSRAVEIALLRLQVKVTNICIKFVSDSADLVLRVDLFTFRSNNGSRGVSIRGIRLAVTKPDVNPGHKLDAADTESSKSDSDEETEDGSYVDASLMDSMVFTHEEASSIYMSAASHSAKSSPEEAPSPTFKSPNEVTMAFIDHINLEFDGLNPISNLTIDINTIRIAAVPLFPTASLIFNTISKMLKLKNHSLRKQNRSGLRKYETSPSESDDDANGVDRSETPEPNIAGQLFNKFRVSEVVICLTSSVTSEGDIASYQDDINIVLRSFTIKQKNLDLMYGGVEGVKILRYVEGIESVVFKFDNTDTRVKQEPDHSSPSPSTNRNRADIRFEIFQKITDQGYLSELTALLSKPAIIDLDCESVQYLQNFATYLKTVQENVTGMIADLSLMKELSSPKGSVSASPSVKNLILLQTASINASVKFLDCEILKVVVLPILLNTLQDQLSAQRIIFSLVSNGVESPFFSIPSIILDTRPKEFKSFYLKKSNSIPHASVLQSSNTLSCGEIQGSVDFKILKTFYRSISGFLKKFEGAKEKINALPAIPSEVISRHSKPAPSSGLANSIYSNQTRYGRFKSHPRDHFAFGDQKIASPFRFTIRKIKFVVTEVSKIFGDLNLSLDHFDLSFQGDSIHGFINDLLVDRKLAELKINQPFFSQLLKVSGSPIALFVHKSNDKGSSTDVTLRKFCLEYYTQWLQLIEKDVTQGHNVEEIVHFAPIEDPQVSLKHSELRVTLIDFFLGLNPSRLESKMCLAVSKGSMDFTMGKEQFYIKCSFREPTVNLIDDVKRLELNQVDLKNSSVSSSVSPHEVVTKLGYTAIGQLNALHVGITVNSDIEKIKSRNKKLGIRGDLSLLDLKINIDDLHAGLCADSANALFQTINDLKTPVYFQSNEKSRTTVDSNFSMPDDILAQIRMVQKNIEVSPPIHPSLASPISKGGTDVSSNFFVVDEYYNREETLNSDVESGLNELSLESSDSNNGDSQLPLVEEHYCQKFEKNVVNVYPFSLHVNLSSIKIYLYDGYDWKYTRKTLRKAVKLLEDRAAELAKNKRKKSAAVDISDSFAGPEEPHSISERHGNKVSFVGHENFHIIEPTYQDHLELSEEDDGFPDGEENEEDKGRHLTGTIFQSIHLTMSESGDPGELINMINSQVQSETQTRDDEIMDSVVNGSQINVDVKKYYKGLKLNRSKAHKGLLDLKNLEVTVTNFTSRDPRYDPTPENMDLEMINRVDVRVGTVTVFDNVPSSTWNKILTYMSVLGEREIGTDMFKLSLTNVRPDPKLAFAEAVIHFQLLPVRLYVDQDTLGFLTRFFEFKDTRFGLPAEDPIYIQKVIVDPIKLKFDYKPKKVDYAGIRSGQHAEFANFFILDGSDIHLKRATFYGISGFAKLGDALKNVYGPYIQKYQLANILLGLSPLRSLVNIGGGVKSLVAVPYKEYKKDKRLIRSLEKGTKSFAKTTTYELLKLGVKLASGTQVILENLEEYFGGEGMAARKPAEKSSFEKKLPSRVTKVNQSNGLLQSSQILRKNTKVEKDTFAGPKLYSNASLDEAEEDNLDLDAVQPSLLVIDSVDGDDEDLVAMDSDEFDDNNEDDKVEKMISLYSNQPSNAKEGLISAYKSLGRNLKITKKSLRRLKDDLKDSDTIQDLLTTIAKLSPVIVIRPVIGTTEAVVKTLMGISNQVDSKHIKESKDKYRSENPE